MALNFNIPGQGNLPQLPGTPQNIQAGPVVPTMTSAIGSGASVLDNGGYDLNVMRYPSEIATVDVPSYIVFNIYVPTTSQYVKTNADSDQTIQSASQNNLDYLHKLKGKPLNGGGNLPGAAVLASLAGGSSFLSTFGATQDLSSAVGAGAGSAVVEGAIASSVNAFSADTIQLKPQLKKIAQSIQLYMPDTVLMQFDHAYDTDKGLTGALGQLGQFAALGKDITTALKGIGGAIKNAYHTGSTKGLAKAVGAVVKNAAESPIGREYVGGLAESTGLVGPGFTQLALRSAGLALNPQVEVLFTGTRNRQFQFEFQFQARSQQEALTILQIINTFKKYAAPSLAKGNAGRYFIVPGQFDIQFKFKNDNNPYIGKISTCVLFNIAVNYVGAGQWATFSDGSPVHINLQLQFMETDIIYSELIDQKGY